MKRQDFAFDETKLKLVFDKSGNAVWSFMAVKEGVKCEKIPIKFLSSEQRKFNREMFTTDKKMNSSIVPLISNYLMTRRVKNALINVLKRPKYVKRYHIQRHNIVQIFARKGLMDNHFNRKVVELAELFGFKPRDYELHHKTPISWGGNNKPDNITLIQRDLHKRLHQLTSSLVNKAYEKNMAKLYTCKHYVMLPVLPPVLTKKNIAEYFNGFDDLLPARDSQNKGAEQEPSTHAPADNKKLDSLDGQNSKMKQSALKNALQDRQAQAAQIIKAARRGQNYTLYVDDEGEQDFKPRSSRQGQVVIRDRYEPPRAKKPPFVEKGEKSDTPAALKKERPVIRERRVGAKGKWEFVSKGR